MTVKLVNDGMAILSMRESDFDAYSAFGEVLDNSIQADAKELKVKVFEASSHKKYTVLDRIAFGDNGNGMSSDILHHCLQLGYSTRYNDRSGIGRFGVGMTLAAINQCKRVEIYSKTAGSEWIWTYVDLDEIMSGSSGMSSIPEPIKKSPPKDCLELVGENSGTLVIWCKYDRQPDTTEKMIEEMHVWIGRVYRYMLWEGLTIRINGDIVKVIDPLYVRLEKTRFPDDPPSSQFDPIKINWTIPFDYQGEVEEGAADVIIKMSLLDASLRPNIGAGGSKKLRDRYIDRNQGISILRNKREVFYGHIPYWPGKSTWFNEKDRYWSCEIHFNAVLDRAFAVKNIKRGAVPTKELKQAIYEAIAPTRETCLIKVTEVWDENKIEQQNKEKGAGGLVTGHEEAEKTAKNTPVEQSELDKGKNIDEEAAKLVDQLHKNVDAKKKAAWIAKWTAQPFTIHDDNWRGPAFIEAIHLGGKDVIRYNNQHPFFRIINEILEDLEGNAEDYEKAVKLKKLIDLLIISYSKAESKFDRNLTFTTEDFVENIRISWGQYLKSYLNTWLSEEGK
ncbi:MAG: ATP-binding protein [bacterium]